MKNTICFILLFPLGLAAAAQNVPYIQAEQITRWKQTESDTVFVLNFWATWCAPCVAELPEFEKLTGTYASEKVQVILVSVDFRRDVEKKLKPFVQRRDLKSRVVFMNEPNAATWIDLVSTEWTGAIPATIVFRKSTGFERFFEKQLDYETLEQAVKDALAKP